MSQESNYTQILKSSVIIGGAVGINLLLGAVRTKFAALLIGTAGVGLLTSFTTVQGLFSTLAGLGIQSSAVREIAASVAKGDEQAIGRTVLTLRRICWLTGLGGLLTISAISVPVSQMTFGSDQYTLDIAALGLIILFGNISGGQMALIQGTRRIGDMARANIVGAIFATVAAIGFYVALGLRGIVPSLVSIAALQLVISWYFARRVPVPQVSLSWRQTFFEAGGMVRLGLVFMWNGLLVSVVSYITVALITQQIGLQGVGLYSAAFALSGIFIKFVLNAMEADYYPRLTGMAQDKTAMNRLVNEQTEIGLLLAVPGLLATLGLAPWIIRFFYTSEFIPAVELLQWFVLGCMGRVISWPLGFMMLALGKGRWFFVAETVANIAHMVLIAVGLSVFGLPGVAIASVVLYVFYTFVVLAVVRYLTAFYWSRGCLHLMASGLIVLVCTFVASKELSLWPATLIGALSTIGFCTYSLRGLVQRIGSDHRLTRAVSKLPIIRAICRY
ncbi:MAG: O-antigen translocase [Gammaproteobacteria bacterium]|nr:O-antigen translocase [Gammaproteobacteria bacterium]MBU1603043.1 O-antigen translocase [Gammaproteobacteria bacterium]MBU2432075.1 O-antigen translocase [Gammaproteobacteria bacterium]MBU2448034.1 O-antigen translocase [Gammaproteobacteria bacterium]